MQTNLKDPPDKNKIEKPLKWFNENISKNIIFPKNTDKKCKLNKKDKNIRYRIYHQENSSNLKIKSIDYDKEFKKESEKKINTNFNKLIRYVFSDKNPPKKILTKEQKEKKIKSKVNEMFNKNLKDIDRINKVVRAKKYILDLNDKQKKLLKGTWIPELKRLYNICIDKFNKDITYFNPDYKAIKKDLFDEVYGNKNKPVPYDVLTDEVRVFCSNLKSCRTNLKNKNIKHFTLNKKFTGKTNYSLLIPVASVNKKGIFTTFLGEINNFNLDELPECDSRLFYNCKTDTFTLIVPTYVDCKKVENRKPIVAIDPGESKFISFYGFESYGHIGINIRKQILFYRNKISKFQKILSKKINLSKNKLKNKRKLKIKIRNYYKKIKNIVKELHNKTANYLCKNYDTIIIPKFETQKMISNKKTFKEAKKEKMLEGKTDNEQKKLGKEFLKRCRLNKNVKYVLGQLSHYSFRQHLQTKCKEYGCQFELCTEEYTSLTCTYCGYRSKHYNEREKECLKCKKKIDRDINGARNILIKTLVEKELLKEMLGSKPKATSCQKELII